MLVRLHYGLIYCMVSPFYMYGVVMFSNKKRCFPPGTFIATPLRVIAIIQLCIAFTVLASYAGHPFMGELYEKKSRMLLLESVMGSQDQVAAREFSSLPYEQRNRIEEEYHALHERMQQPVEQKLMRSLYCVLFEMPPFVKAWVFFSIVISLFLLLKISGAAAAAWILPLIVLAYGFENFRHRNEGNVFDEGALFPTEQLIVEHYLREPLSGKILEQKEQLTRGWRNYLVAEWAKEEYSKDPALFDDQVRRGTFHFNLARISAQKEDASFANSYKPPPVLLLYFLWNLFFAGFISFSFKD